MTISDRDRRALEELDFRLRTVLPEAYQDTYEELQPRSMGSAGLKYGDDGRVAWDQMWGSFCDLAMAGGPPHKGLLLEPGRPREIASSPELYRQVSDEICRGVALASDLRARASPAAGWVRVECHSEGMAGWLLRAIVMENVAARSDGRTLDLPCAPGFRLEKEIKNVVTVIAKTSHYWLGHMPWPQQRAIAGLFAALAATSPLVEPAPLGDDVSIEAETVAWAALAERIHSAVGLPSSERRYAGWLGVTCPSVRTAVWIMRAMVVSNVLSRREGDVLFIPVNPLTDPLGERVSRYFARICSLARLRGLL